MNLALYTRISRDPDGTSEAPGRQEEACRSWAERSGHRIVRAYEDRDVSGYKAVSRPGFEQMMAEIEGVDGIVCWRIDRLLRNWRDWARLDTLFSTGKVLFTEDGSDSRRDSMSMEIKVSFAKEESRKTSERLIAQRKAAALDGRAPSGGNRMFGYTRSREVVEEEALEIRAAASVLLNGGTVLGIVRDWTERGVRTPTGGQWCGSTLRAMLSNPTLAGFRVHKGQVFPAQWTPILSESQHKSLQRLFLSRSRLRPPVKHWCSGMLSCPCGEKLGANRAQYKCRCGKVSIQIARAEAVVEDALRWRVLRSKVTDEQPDYGGEVAEKEERLQRWDDEFAFGTMDRFTYRRIREQLLHELEEVRIKQERVVFQFPADFDRWWPQISFLEKSSFLRRLAERIVVNPPGRGRRANLDYDASLFSVTWR